MSFGLGLDHYIDTVAGEAGADKLYIMAKGRGAPGMDENFFITQKEIDFVDKIKGVKHISGMYFRAGEISFRDQRKYIFVIGMDSRTDMDFLEEK